jgi:hypothetical protein
VAPLESPPRSTTTPYHAADTDGVRIGGNVLAACFIIDLPELGGAAKVRKLGVPVRTLVSFEGHQRARSTSRSGFEP